MGAWAVDEQLAELGRALSKRVDARPWRWPDQITAEVSFYREQRTVSPAELRKAALALTCRRRAGCGA